MGGSDLPRAAAELSGWTCSGSTPVHRAAYAQTNCMHTIADNTKKPPPVNGKRPLGIRKSISANPWNIRSNQLAAFAVRNAKRRAEQRIGRHLAFHVKHVADKRFADDPLRLALGVDLSVLDRYEMVCVPAG